MKQNQGGFTLIELVMVIVILGVLSAVALPKFVDLKGDAQTASVQGAAGALSSAAAINYASAQLSKAGSYALSGAAASFTVSNLGVAPMPPGVGVGSAGASSGTVVCGTAGTAVNVVFGSSGGTSANTATATLICTG
jgi:MSHA pilin protein MshA